MKLVFSLNIFIYTKNYTRLSWLHFHDVSITVSEDFNTLFRIDKNYTHIQLR